MRSQEDIQLIKALQFTVESLQANFDALMKDYDAARQALHDARLENSGQAAQLERKRPEPSRLEIAATLVASRFSSTSYVTEVKGTWIKYALEGADALIAAAKEGK